MGKMFLLLPPHRGFLPLAFSLVVAVFLWIALSCVTTTAREPDASPSLPDDSFAASSVREICQTRFFEEPLLPVGGVPTAEDTKALSQALRHPCGG